MPIIKNQSRKHVPFVMVAKNFLDDPRLSLKAKGLFTYLIFKPPDWQVFIADIVKRASDGETAVRTGLNELRKFGYAKFGPIRGANRRLNGTGWTIIENPTESQVSPRSENPIIRKSDSQESPTSGKSAPTKP